MKISGLRLHIFRIIKTFHYPPALSKSTLLFYPKSSRRISYVINKMPPIDRFHCDTCDFTMPSGWGSYVYAVDDEGARIRCPHPGENVTVELITGMSITKARVQGRSGGASPCVCTNCLEQRDIDLKIDFHICPSCSVGGLCSANDLVGEQCPKCIAGTFIRTKTGVMS